MARTLTAPGAVSATEVQRTRAFLDHVFPPPRDFAVRLWEGTVVGGERSARYTLVLNRPGTLRRMFGLPVELALGEAFFRADFDIEGDFYAAFELKELAKGAVASPAKFLDLVRLWRSLPEDPASREVKGRGPARLWGLRHSRHRDRAAIQYHYDVSNDFYRLWLDRNLVYSCGYFPTGREDLDTAQELKLDLICRKLRLQPGERLLDIGCGWGGLILHAARHYGVRALGVTLSEQQHRLARQRIAEFGLEEQIRVELRDYRDLTGAPFDKVASVGMFEHAGREHAEYFARVHRLLRPGGLFLNHAIATPPHAEAWAQHSLLRTLLTRRLLGVGVLRERYLFPDGKLVPVSEANLQAEEAGFEVRDLENLREHYALTLRSWFARLEANREGAVLIAGETVYRTWKLYLAGAALAFEEGDLSVNQTLFARPLRGHRSVPLSRADLYR